MSGDKPIKRDELGRVLPGSAGLPGAGRKTKDESVLEAEELLAELSPKAVRRLGALLDDAEPKIQAQVALGIVKVTIGELQRLASKDGGNPLGLDLSKWTPEQILELTKKR